MNMIITSNPLRHSMVALALALVASASVADIGKNHHQHKPRADTPVSTDEHAFGGQGDPKKVTRTIAVDMSDTMRFGPANLTVRQGRSR